MQIDPLTCGYDRMKQHHAFLSCFVFRLISILSFKNRKIEKKKTLSKCPKSQPGVVFKDLFGYEVCLRYITTFVSVSACVHVQETNIEPQTHDIFMFCACVCKSALCALFYKCAYM